MRINLYIFFYERCIKLQVLYVVTITSILGRLLLVSVNETGTIQFSVSKGASNFSGASCYLKKDAAYGNPSRWWYSNSWPWALKWATSQ